MYLSQTHCNTAEELVYKELTETETTTIHIHIDTHLNRITT